MQVAAIPGGQGDNAGAVSGGDNAGAVILFPCLTRS